MSHSEVAKVARRCCATSRAERMRPLGVRHLPLVMSLRTLVFAVAPSPSHGPLPLPGRSSRWRENGPTTFARQNHFFVWRDSAESLLRSLHPFRTPLKESWLAPPMAGALLFSCVLPKSLGTWRGAPRGEREPPRENAAPDGSQRQLGVVAARYARCMRARTAKWRQASATQAQRGPRD